MICKNYNHPVSNKYCENCVVELLPYVVTLKHEHRASHIWKHWFNSSYLFDIRIDFGHNGINAPKGTSKHKRAGYFYCIAMLGVNITALMIYQLFGSFGIFHWLSILSLFTLCAGMIPVIESGIPNSTFYNMTGIAVGITMGLAAYFIRKKHKTWSRFDKSVEGTR